MEGWKAAAEEDPQREPPGVETKMCWELRKKNQKTKNREGAVYF